MRWKNCTSLKWINYNYILYITFSKYLSSLRIMFNIHFYTLWTQNIFQWEYCLARKSTENTIKWNRLWQVSTDTPFNVAKHLSPFFLSEYLWMSLSTPFFKGISFFYVVIQKNILCGGWWSGYCVISWTSVIFVPDNSAISFNLRVHFGN
jgi:hypothetical protein